MAFGLAWQWKLSRALVDKNDGGTFGSELLSPNLTASPTNFNRCPIPLTMSLVGGVLIENAKS